MVELRIEIPAYYIEYDKGQLRKVLRQAGKEVADLAAQMIRSTSRPSAPGGPPANRTGNLADNLKLKTKDGGQTVLIMDVAESKKSSGGKSLFYARFLEDGATGGGGRKGQRKRRGFTQRVMLPRPFLSTALEQKRDDIDRRVKDALLNGIAFKPGKSKKAKAKAA